MQSTIDLRDHARWDASALLRREMVEESDPEAIRTLVGKRVLVTGAAGSIGSELSRQLYELRSDVYFLDCDESRLHSLTLQLGANGLLDDHHVILADIRDRDSLHQLFREIRPEVVFHAAAHKHLPLLERFPSEGVKTNVLGTANVVDASVASGTDAFILVSSDKAADPSSVLGATKRIAERIVESARMQRRRYVSVRFGNVLGSRGSFLDTLRHRVQGGMPISITDPDAERFFMTIPEAVQLVIGASTMRHGGGTYVLDMGTPVRIVDIVHRYAEFLGVPAPTIEFVGLREGEKRTEVLFSLDETREDTTHPRIWRTPGEPIGDGGSLRLQKLLSAAARADDQCVRLHLKEIVTGDLVGGVPE